MLGLVVNSYIDENNMEDYEVHRSKMSTMDLVDMSVPRMEINIVVDEGMPDMETDDDEEPLPSDNINVIIQFLDVTPLQVVVPCKLELSRRGRQGDTLARQRGQPKMSSPLEPPERRHLALPGVVRPQCHPSVSSYPKWRPLTS